MSTISPGSETDNCSKLLTVSFQQYACVHEEPILERENERRFLVHLKTDRNNQQVLNVLDCDTTQLRDHAQKTFDLLKKMNHPNIVSVLSTELHTKSSKYCRYVGEYPDLLLLSQLIKEKHSVVKGPLKILKAFFQIAKGVKELKDRGIIHKDLSVSSIEVHLHSEFKIGNFGSCIEGEQTTTPSDDVTTHDPRFFDAQSVEKRYDWSVNIFNLGMILYSMQFSHLPFVSLNSRMYARQMVEGNYVIGKSNPFIAFLIFHMLTKNVSKRPTIEQLLKWTVLAVRWTRDSDNDEKTVALGIVNINSEYPESGWNGIGMESVPSSKNFLDLEQSGLLVKYDWALADYIKTRGIDQNTDLDKIPVRSSKRPTEPSLLNQAGNALMNLAGFGRHQIRI